MTTALQQFDLIFERAWSQIVGSFHILEAFNKDLVELGEPEKDYNEIHEVSDMARFGIVLTVAAMDDYFTRKYAEVLVQSLKKHGVTPAFAKMLEDAGLDIAGALELLQMKKPYSRIRKISQDYYSRHVTQSENNIDSLFETLGISNLCTHAQRRARRKTLLSSVRILVNRRHKIVHAGDLSRTGLLAKIDKRALTRIKDVKLFVNCADQHIGKFLNQKPRKR